MTRLSLDDRNVLKEKREAFSFSQQELATKAGMRQSVVAEIETGKRIFSKRSQQRLWNALIDLDQERRDMPTARDFVEAAR